MRSTLKFAVPLAVAALALGACGTKGGDTSTPAAPAVAPRPACDYKIGMFGALTGPNANLGIYIQNGVNLALDDYNKKHADCKVTLENYDSQGDPTQAPALAKKAIDDKKVVGIVGPAFSGESKAADPAFNEAGLVTITPSATNPKLADNGWKTFFRALGNDATQGPAAAKYIKDTLKADEDRSSSTTRPSTARAWPTSSARTSARPVVGNDTIQQKQTDFSASVTKVTSPRAPTRSSSVATRPRPRRSSSSCVTPAGRARSSLADGVKDQSFIDNAKARPPRAPSSPARACRPTSHPTSQAAYKAKYNEDPNTYSGEGYDSATILLDGIAAGKDRSSMIDFVKSYDKKGVTKQLKFDAKGESSDIKVFAYKVEGGKFTSVGEIK